MKYSISVFLIFISISVFGQQDTVKKLSAIEVRGYYNPQTLLRSISSVALLDSNQIRNQANSSLVGMVNTLSGVRMEERSPGSYRLSLRGSLLRSPFGVRNIKIYVDEFPLTDAGGNTYLNLLDVAAIGSMEIYKGPESSSFGANTGGALLISSADLTINKTKIDVSAGSFGLFHQSIVLTQSLKNYDFNFTQGYQRSDGYRENSGLSRKYIQTTQRWRYSPHGNLKAFLFYSDLDYETPGGLTIAQMELNPKSARPATPATPSAIQQRAAIYNKTFFGGLVNNYSFNNHFKHVIALFANHTNFQNPFITNFEKRKESTFGFRTFVAYENSTTWLKYNMQLGVENSNTKTDFKNYGNSGGNAASLTAADDLNAQLTFAFLRMNFDISQRLLLELGSSINFFGYQYESLFPTAVANKKRNFNNELMPKFAASYLINPSLTIRGSVSKGYSPPTLAEVRSSDNVINTNLQAENGWNYETGLRYKSKNGRFYAEGIGFYFHLKDAIVRRLNTNDVEYFVNAGGTKQAGLELNASLLLVKTSSSNFLNAIRWNSTYTYNHFKFTDFQNGAVNYSGNKLTGVPNHVAVNSFSFDFKKGLYLFAQHNYTSTIPLNDANTVFAKKYHLADVKTGIRNLDFRKCKVEIYLGINNLLNQKYSLGNDLNAANNRYFNPSMGVNFYSGASVSF